MKKAFKKVKKNIKDTIFHPMTLEEFNHRIDQSFSDSENERLTDNDDLAKEIQEWS